MADDDASIVKYRNVNPNDSAQMKLIIEEELKSDFFEQTPSISLPIAKLTLQYYLTKGGIDWKRLFDAHLLPFRAPTPARDFFLWIWDVFFPDELWEIETGDIVENDDQEAPMRDALAEPRKRV